VSVLPFPPHLSLPVSRLPARLRRSCVRRRKEWMGTDIVRLWRCPPRDGTRAKRMRAACFVPLRAQTRRHSSLPQSECRKANVVQNYRNFESFVSPSFEKDLWDSRKLKEADFPVKIYLSDVIMRNTNVGSWLSAKTFYMVFKAVVVFVPL